MDNPRILVVEDEAITAMDIRTRLEKLQYTVVDTLFTGEEAVVVATNSKPDLILMDIVLKGEMDGTEAASIITSKLHIPIIFLTAYNDNKTFNRAKMSLPYGYLTKPFETQDLQIAIELALYRRDMELKLAIAEQHYATLMDNASCGIVSHDRNGNILDINKMGETLFGEVKNVIVGKDFKSYVIPSEREYYKVMLNKVTVERSISSHEGHFLQSNGNIIDLEFSSACVNIGDKEILLTILTDMTETNQLRKQSMLNEKLATIGTLSAGIMHEINNPLSWMLTNLSLLSKKLAKLEYDQNKTLGQEFKEITEETLDGAKRIQDIVFSLKGFAHADEDEFTPTDINKVLLTTIKMVSGESKQRAKIETEFQSNLPLALINSGKLQQVFLNIVINAIQAFPEGKIDNNLIRINTSLVNNKIIIEMMDNGEGIPPENISKIFDPFFTTKPAGKGSGLGLSICHDIINSFRGNLSVKSALGEGTTFTISIPMLLNLDMDSLVNTKLSKDENTRRFKLLIIDDEPILLKTLKRVLSPSYDVTTIEGGRNALEILNKDAYQFSVIISDLNMPEVSGADLYRYVTIQYPGIERRFIFISGIILTAVQDAFLKSITNSTLKKPLQQNELLDTIRKICHGNEPD